MPVSPFGIRENEIRNGMNFGSGDERLGQHCFCKQQRALKVDLKLKILFDADCASSSQQRLVSDIAVVGSMRTIFSTNSHSKTVRSFTA